MAVQILQKGSFIIVDLIISYSMILYIKDLQLIRAQQMQRESDAVRERKEEVLEVSFVFILMLDGISVAYTILLIN